MKRNAAVWAAVIALVVMGACREVTFEGGAPVSITLTSDRTTAKIGQDIIFDFDATGSILDGVTLEYGDGVADTVYASGAMTAHGQFLYAYASAGTFTAVGTAHDARQGPAMDTVIVQITGG